VVLHRLTEDLATAAVVAVVIHLATVEAAANVAVTKMTDTTDPPLPVTSLVIATMAAVAVAARVAVVEAVVTAAMITHHVASTATLPLLAMTGTAAAEAKSVEEAVAVDTTTVMAVVADMNPDVNPWVLPAVSLLMIGSPLQALIP